jgi:F0F1-type ATP synthase membrane subunit b/b'
MSLAAVEAKIKVLWEDLTSEARADIQEALDDAKAAEAEVVQQVKAAITEAKLDAEAVITAAEPELAASVRNLVDGLESKVIAILGNLAK